MTDPLLFEDVVITFKGGKIVFPNGVEFEAYWEEPQDSWTLRPVNFGDCKIGLKLLSKESYVIYMDEWSAPIVEWD
jgi:hypothetical protein